MSVPTSSVGETSLHEISQDFSSLEEWTQWLTSNPWAIDGAYIERCVEEVKRKGCVDPLFGLIPPEQIDASSKNYREGLIAKELNARLRAVCFTLVDELLARGAHLRVYASEAVSHFAQIMQRVVDYQGSEYLPTPEDRKRHPGIRHEDVTALTFHDQAFDAYITNEVLEHIPSIGAALSEAHRILKPGGLFFGTFPMAYVSATTIKKAVLENGEVLHLMEPEYHGNPVDPSGGSLVFNIPGWDIIEQARAAGFADPRIRFVSSRRHAILGAEIAGILLFVARRN